MSKTVSASLTTHIAQEVTSLATCWRITRTDDAEFFFTDHDVDLTVSTNVFRADTGYTRTAIQNDATLAVDNLDIEGFFNSSAITQNDLRAGKFDYAQIRVFVVNHQKLSMGTIKMRNGRIGEVTLTEQGVFRAELRGMTQELTQRVGEVYQPECRADLGDTRCKVPINPADVSAAVAYASGAFVKVSTGTGTLQEKYENIIYEVTTSGTTGKLFPSTFAASVGASSDWDIEASALMTFTGQPGNGDTVTVGIRVFTYQTVLTEADGNVLIGASIGASRKNLAHAITLASGAGTLYASAMTLHASVTASIGAVSTIFMTSKKGGTQGNSIVTSTNITSATFASTTMLGGSTGAHFTAREAWMRDAVIISASTDRKKFRLSTGFSEARASVNSWFEQGVFIFEDGDNVGNVVEIRGWVASTNEVELFLPTPFAIASGTKGKLYPGCDKMVSTCINKFVMPNTSLFANGNVKNFRGEPFVPGQDELVRTPDAK